MRVEGSVIPPAREVADASHSAPLDPEHSIVVVRLQQERQMGTNVGGSFTKARSLIDILEALKLDRKSVV